VCWCRVGLKLATVSNAAVPINVWHAMEKRACDKTPGTSCRLLDIAATGEAAAGFKGAADRAQGAKRNGKR